MKLNQDLIIRIIGIYQIIGGLIGLIGLVRYGLGLLLQNFIAFFIVSFVFSFGISCGIMLLKREYLIGVNLSLVNQFFQLSQIKILGFGFEYISGTYFALGFSDEPTFSFQYYYATYKSSFFITYSRNDNEISVLINLVAIILFVFLSNIHDRMNRSTV
jgi:hypothetical protein